MSFSRNVVDLPLILCGPIVRWVGPDAVSVFVALKEARMVELVVEGVADFKGARETVALGEHLHVVVVTAESNGTALSSGTRYQYNLTFWDKFPMPDPAKTRNLRDHDSELLGVAYRLWPIPEPLPSFLLPPDDVHDLRIVHGSCRKPHGEGNDSLAIVDSLIADPERRPHQLFLTGDQIYADDVQPALLRAIYETAQKLLGWSETLLLGSVAVKLADAWDGSPLGDVPNPPHKDHPDRASYLKSFARYTSGEMEAHLMFLGEFYIMYLMVWSDVLWTENVRQEAELRIFAETIPHVRRVLANTPTYMMFDDHDVTDDWNIDGQWVQDVQATILGRRMLRNALLAYAVFQDWGNQPYDYAGILPDIPPGTELLNYLTYVKPDSLPGTQPEPQKIESEPEAMDALLDIGDASTVADARKRWHYAVSGPVHQVIVLDTRTWRDFTMDGEGAGLINEIQLQEQLDQHVPAPPSDTLTLVVSPAPVIGLPILEEGIQKVIALFSPHSADDEAWLSNRTIFEKLLAKLAKFERVAILSGDVHYGFTHSMAYFARDGAAYNTARIVQLCASSQKNEDWKTRSLGWAQWLTYQKNQYFGWHAALPAAETAEAKEKLREQPAAFFEFIFQRQMDAPTVIGGALGELRSHFDPALGQANWEYAVDYHCDGRNPTDREKDFLALTTPGAHSPYPEALNALGVWPQKIAGYTNIGLIDFPKVPGALSPQSPERVRHRLAWHPHPIDKEVTEQARRYAFFTEFLVPFTRPNADKRPGAN